jgi:hypothetical protein
MVGDGQREGMAHRVSIAEEVDRLASLSHAVRLEELAPLLELAACLGLDLTDVGNVSARHRLISCGVG